MDTVKNFLNKNVNSINPNKLPGSFRDIFDNITWTVVLVATLFVLILVYLSTRTFFTDNRINSLKKEMKNRPKLQGVEVKSESGQEEEFDEIDIKEHRLIDIQIAASAKSYLIGRQLFDYASPEMVIQCLKMGAKYIELDVFLNRNRQVIVSNGLSSGNWKLNFNQIKFEDMCQRLAATLFNPDELGNANDPMILFLNLNLKKSDMETVFQAIQFNFKDNLAPTKYSIKGGEDILQAPLQELLGKLIIMTSGPIGDTSLDQVVHLRIGDRLQRIYFTDLVKKDRREMILYNKYHLTIVVPPVGIRSINYNPETALDYGCQIVAMHYQRNDDFLQNYLSHFREKSFRIKPFEFTRFHDIPQKGYDQNKIAYYNTNMPGMPGNQLGVNPDKNIQDIDANFTIEYSASVNLFTVPETFSLEYNKLNTGKSYLDNLTYNTDYYLNLNTNFYYIPFFTDYYDVSNETILLVGTEFLIEDAKYQIHKSLDFIKPEQIKFIPREDCKIMVPNPSPLECPAPTPTPCPKISRVPAPCPAYENNGFTDNPHTSLTSASISEFYFEKVSAPAGPSSPCMSPISSDYTLILPEDDFYIYYMDGTVKKYINTQNYTITDSPVTTYKYELEGKDKIHYATLNDKFKIKITNTDSEPIISTENYIFLVQYDRSEDKPMPINDTSKENMKKIYHKVSDYLCDIEKIKSLSNPDEIKDEIKSIQEKIKNKPDEFKSLSINGSGTSGQKTFQNLLSYKDVNNYDLIPSTITISGGVFTIENIFKIDGGVQKIVKEDEPIRFSEIDAENQIGITNLTKGPPLKLEFDTPIPDEIEYIFIKDGSITELENKSFKIEAIDGKRNTKIIKDPTTSSDITITEDSYDLKMRKFCCQTNLDDSMYNLNNLKQKNCESKNFHTFEANNKCKNNKTDVETPVVISDYGFNAIRIKLQKLNIAEHPDIVDIEKLGERGDPQLDFYIQKHVFLEDSKNLIESKLDLIYFILTKQLKKALHQERTKLFMTDYEDKCIDLNENQCVEEPICYVDRSEKKKECNPDTDRVPFPQYCLPRYIVGNRNQCFDDEYEGSEKKKFGAISNESIRSQYHQLMTGSSPFTGNWSSIGGIIEIPDTFNPYCEFKFITEADQKEYTMYLVKEDGSNIEIDTFQQMDSTQKGLRAKGTFVDRKLREVELRNNDPQLPYHGFADMKIIVTEDFTIDKCFNNNFSATKFLGIYQYSDIVTTKGDKDKKNYLLNSEEEYLVEEAKNNKNYCYRMENVECNRQLQGIFGRLPEASFSELVPQISDFSKNDLSPIEGFSSGDNLREGFGNMGQDIETFENPYDPEVINPLTLTGEVTLEFDAEEMALSENGAPAASLLEGILDEAQKSASASAKNRNSLQKSGSTNQVNQTQKGKEDLDLNLNNNDNTDLNNLMNESEGLYAKCIQENGEWKFQFNPGSTLIGTFYEPLFNKKCQEYGERLKVEQTKNLAEIDKLNLSEISKYKLKENLKEKDINLTDKNLNRIKRLIGKNPKKLDPTLEKLVNKMSAEQIDTKNMYQTKKSPEGQNIVDTIRHKKHEPEKGIYPLCLKRYKYDEERCFRPKKPDKKLKCPPSECYDAVLVIGSCSLNSYDIDPFYFETYTHFKIQPHPDNKNRRIIYFNYQEDARNCEKNLDYFSSTIERKQLKHEIAMLTARLQTYTNQEVELTEEQQQEYDKLETDIAKLESQKGEFTPPPGESRVDEHAETVKLAENIKKKTKKYNNFKIDIKRKEIERMKKIIKENQDILNGASQEIKKKEESGEFYSISKKMCLKYGFRGSSVLVKLLYEDDRRNLTKGFKSDWLIQKYLDESGKHTGQYKIRADIGGTLFNLSQKPVPITPQGPAAAFFPIIQPKPKLKHQLWVIKEVGDLNNPREIGETDEEGNQKDQIQKDRDDFSKELDEKHQQQMTGLGTGKPKPPY